jgi:hypothetical protein
MFFFYLLCFSSVPKVNGNTWPLYSVTNHEHNLTYLELNPSHHRLGRVFTHRYDGFHGYSPNVINDCLNYWDSILCGQF